MHIPDGYLSPQTCAVLGAAMIPIWGTAAAKLKKTLREKQVPLLAIGSAFSFTIMMYNIPVPNGTTAHAVGASIVAIILGPWAATVSISITLILQALFFGDGGILALGANIFNMAFVIPFLSYFIYYSISGNTDIKSKRRTAAAIIAAYVSINFAALFTAIELGIQPLLFHKPDGTPLYAPYGILQTVPPMLFGHLLVAGPLEAVITGLVTRYLQHNNPDMLEIYPNKNSKAIGKQKKLWSVLILLIIFVPLGLLAKGTAYGEWSKEEIRAKLGYIPDGMAKFSDWWKAVLPNYSFGGEHTGLFGSSLGYILCAIIALVIILGITVIMSVVKKEKHDN